MVDTMISRLSEMTLSIENNIDEKVENPFQNYISYISVHAPNGKENRKELSPELAMEREALALYLYFKHKDQVKLQKGGFNISMELNETLMELKIFPDPIQRIRQHHKESVIESNFYKGILIFINDAILNKGEATKLDSTKNIDYCEETIREGLRVRGTENLKITRRMISHEVLR